MNKDIVRKYYSNNPMWYHTRKHIEDLYFLYKVYRDDFRREFPDLDEEKLFTCFDFHDAVYVPGSETNEEDSVQVYLNEGGRDQEVIDAILSTKVGFADFKNSLQKVLHDLDWSGFRERMVMEQNERRIFAEAVEKGEISESAVADGYLEFLRSVRGKNIYVTKTFEGFNEVAKTNIERRIGE